MKLQLFIYLIFSLFFSCAGKETKTLWVYPYLLDKSLAPYAEPGLSLLTQESEELGYSQWTLNRENFIFKGFDFEEGYFYKILLESGENEPMSSWKLKSILEKKQDWVAKIEGNWQNVPIPGQAYFPIGIRVNKVNRSLLTFGGCASGLTGLGEVSERKIQLAYTYYRFDINKICFAQNPSASPDFGFVRNTVEYEITSDGFLEFFDSNGNILIRFQPSE